MKILHFYFRGMEYLVNEKGEINANNIGRFSPDWIFLGGSEHHWHNHITVPLAKAFEWPLLLNRCLGWDRDHGTVRQWRGYYYSRIARIQNAYIEEREC